jgi:hypothetical protein
MRRKLIVGTVLALVVAVASVPLAFARSGSHPDGRDRAVQNIHLTTKVLQSADLDLGDPGPSVGDRFVFSDEVFLDGEKVGMDGGECVIVLFQPGPDPQGEPAAVSAQCVATVMLPDGQITAQGLVDFTQTEPFTIAVTGGTGKYRTAHGEVTVTEESEEVGVLDIRLIL